MYYYLAGKLAGLKSDRAVIDCGGVGYLTYISGTTFERLSKVHPLTTDGSADFGDVKLYTHLAVSEDAMDLYGFYDEEERDVFRLLITVSGIGPKGALSVLTSLTPAEIALACASDDAKAISKANGIGSKTAQKVILELKDKIAKLVDTGHIEESADDEGPRMTAGLVTDAVNALTVLGYTRSEAAKAVKTVEGTTVEELIRKALQKLMR